MTNKEQAEKAFAKWASTANAFSKRDIFLAGYFSALSDENMAHQLEAQGMESRNKELKTE